MLYYSAVLSQSSLQCICICIFVYGALHTVLQRCIIRVPSQQCLVSPVVESQTELGADLKPRPTLILTPPTIHYDALRYIALNYITLDGTALN